MRMCLQSDSSHVEKTGEFAIKIFPEGFVLSWDCPTQMAYTFSFIELRKILCEFHKYRISLSHTMHDREIWGAFIRDAGGWYHYKFASCRFVHAPGMRDCSMRTCQFLTPQVLEVGHTTDRRWPFRSGRGK